MTTLWIEKVAPKRKSKWDWFHAEHPNDSQIWFHQQLKELRILK